MRKNFGLDESEPRLTRFLTSLAALPLGFYEAFFGSGNGIFTAAVLTTARGFTLPRSLGYYYAISFTWCLLAAAVYIRAGNLKLALVIPAAIGSLCGAWLGSHIGAQKGAAFVKSLFIALGTILGLKLLLAF